MNILTTGKKRVLRFAHGLVGLAQVNGRRCINIFKKIELDLHYVENVSIWLDLKIVLKSLKVIVAKENVNSVNGYVLREIEDLKVSNGEVEFCDGLEQIIK